MRPPPSLGMALTPTWHTTTYPSLTPTLPALTQHNRTIIITGAGRGIGHHIALAYAAASAARLCLVGRTQASLAETQARIATQHPAVEISTHVADVGDEEAVRRVAREVGAWDVLVLNAGAAMVPGGVEAVEGGDWWRVFETNVRGAFLMLHHLLPTRRPSASIIGISAGMVNLPATAGPCIGNSAYASSKFAQLRLLDHVAGEHPDVFVASVHPGVVETDMVRGMGHDPTKGVVGMDDISLPAHFVVWMSSPEASFLRGKFVYANWDVEELKARREEIEGTPMLTAGVLGWPFAPK